MLRKWGVLLVLILSVQYVQAEEGILPTGKECSGEFDPLCADVDLGNLEEFQNSPRNRNSTRHHNQRRRNHNRRRSGSTRSGTSHRNTASGDV